MRLNAFFAKPITPKEPTSDRGAKSTAKGPETKVGPESKSGQLSDYEKTFPSFYLQSHVKLAPVNRFERDPDALVHICGKIDKCFQGEGDGSFTPGKLNATELFNIIPYKRRHGRLSSPTVREILTSINKPSISHIDLTKDDGAAKRTTRIEDMLKEIPMKTLKFREDVRPPYNGTFTRKLSDGAAVKLSRNPFARVNDVFNYDYDSEAEWEEPEEGEDIDSEGEEDASEDGDDDMEDFLDDTGDQVNRGTVSDLEPICSGIKWDHENGVDPAFEPYKMEMISGMIIRETRLLASHANMVVSYRNPHIPHRPFLRFLLEETRACSQLPFQGSASSLRGRLEATPATIPTFCYSTASVCVQV